MYSRLFITLLVLQILINNVWASTHMAESDHTTHSIPHVHFDSEIKTQPGPESNLENTSEHSVDSHFHFQMLVYLIFNNSLAFERPVVEKSFIGNFRLTSLIYSPPVPPPTA